MNARLFDVIKYTFTVQFLLFLTASLVGSIISSTILRPPGGPDENNTLSQEEVYEYCGVNDCPWNNISNPGLADPDDKTVRVSVCVCVCVSMCVCVCLLCVGRINTTDIR